MKIRLLFLFIILAQYIVVIGQSPQDCINAIPVCQNVIIQPTGFMGTGTVPNEINPANSCLPNGERNDVWYTFTVQTAGNLRFMIRPNNPTDDYNWSGFNLTNKTCSDIYTDPSLEVSCNASSALDGRNMDIDPSGMGHTGAFSNHPYYGDILYPACTTDIAVQTGERYYINVSNHTGSSGGFQIDFSGSTAVLFNPAAPAFSHVVPPTCGQRKLKVRFNKPIDCPTVSASDFQLPGYTITNVTSPICSALPAAPLYVLHLSQPLGASGGYNLQLVGAISDHCGNTTSSDNVSFTVNPAVANAGNDQIFCLGNNVNVTLGDTTHYPNVTYQWGSNTTTGLLGLSSTTIRNPILNLINPPVDTLEFYQTISVGSCTNTDTVLIIINDCCANYDAQIVNIQNVGCHGTASGMATATAVGSISGANPQGFNYQWNNGQTTIQATVLSANVPYTVFVTDPLGCVDSATVTLSEPVAPIAAVANGSTLACYGDNTGTIDLVVSGGTPPFTYQWSTGATTEDIYGLSQGFYFVTVADANNCTVTANGWVAQPPSPFSVTGTGNTVACGASNGAITLNPTGGGAPYNFQWSNGATTQNITNLTAGTYTVTVTDLFGCKKIENIEVTSASGLTATTTGSTLACSTTPTGSVNVSASNGSMPYSYLWSSGQTSSSVNNLAPGIYTVTVTDGTGCQYVSSATIDVLSILNVSNTTNNVSCNGGNDGSIILNVYSNQLTPPTYQWSNGATTKDITNLSAGNYSVTVTDQVNCSKTMNLMITEPNTLGVALTKTDITCFGNGNGTISPTVTGGTAPYTYLWSNGITTANLVGLQSGTYSLTVTDAKGCTTTATASISEPAQLLAFAAPSFIFCHGDATGSINLTISGGVTPYTYNWSNGATTSSLTGITAGIYSVTVTDASGCTRLALGNVLQNAAINPTITGSALACGGDNNGTVLLSVAGGAFPYSYLWSNGETTANLSNKTAGTYTVTITDNAGCTKTATTTITEPTPLVATAIGSTTLCNGDASGTIAVNVSGGSAPYSFGWSNNAGGQQSSSSGGSTTQQNLTGLTAGVYTVTVTDINGCSEVVSATVIDQAPIVATTAMTPTSCHGSSDGGVNLNVTGGVAPYTYLWSNNSTTQNQTALAAGVHFVTITDANGCTITTSDVVGQPQGMTITNTLQNASCLGNTDGHINLQVLGGNGAPYSFVWDNGLGTVQNPTGLGAGTYVVTVTDGGGCTATASYTVNEPALLTIATIDSTAKCNNPDGAIQAIPAGGTAPYTYNWSANTGVVNSVATATNLPPGFYGLTVTDANNCIAATNVTFANAPFFKPTAIVNDPFCQPDNGVIELHLDTLQHNFGYQWSGNANTGNVSTAHNLTADNYFVTVTRAQCDTMMAFTLVPTSQLDIVETIKSATCNQSNGQIILNTQSATAPITYNWSSNANSTGAIANNLAADVYKVTITDANCSIEKTITVDGTDALGVTNIVQNPTCNETGTIVLTPTTGTAPFNYSWSSNANAGNSSEVTNLAEGNYGVTITDAVGCSQTLSFTLVQDGGFDILVDNIVNNSCPDDDDGSIDITTNSLSNDLSYNWSNGETTEDIYNLRSLAYSVTVTDNISGCTAHETFSITEPNKVLIDAGPDITISPGQTVELEVVTNGQADLNYSWVTDMGAIFSGKAITVNPERTTKYTVSASIGSCTPVVDEIMVNVTNKGDLLIPDAFSPNNDGKNDVFNLFPATGVEIIEFNVYNRWGERMHSNPTQGWDGKHREIRMPAGAYIYLVVIEKADGSRANITGEVVLIR